MNFNLRSVFLGGAIWACVACAKDNAAPSMAVDVKASSGATISVTTAAISKLAGTTLVIPPNALRADARITLQPGGTPGSAQDSEAIGPVAVWGPDGTTFAPAAKMTLPYQGGASVVAGDLFVQVEEAGGKAFEVPASALTINVPAGTVSFPVDGFSRFHVRKRFRKDASPGDSHPIPDNFRPDAPPPALVVNDASPGDIRASCSTLMCVFSCSETSTGPVCITDGPDVHPPLPDGPGRPEVSSGGCRCLDAKDTCSGNTCSRAEYTCNALNACPAGYTCSDATRTCVCADRGKCGIACKSSADCPSGTACQPSNGACLASPRCAYDEMCAQDEFCMPAGQGGGSPLGACRKKAASLPVGASCKSSLECTEGLCHTGVCLKPCIRTSECASQQVCSRIFSSDHPSIVAGCVAQTTTKCGSCVGDQVCWLTECANPNFCRSAADCGGGECWADISGGNEKRCSGGATCNAGEVVISDYVPACGILRSCWINADCPAPYICTPWSRFGGGRNASIDGGVCTRGLVPDAGVP